MRAADYEGLDPAVLPEYQRRFGAKQAARHNRIVTIPFEERKAHTIARMAEMDALTPEIRALVHEFGLPKVKKRLGMSARAMRISIEQERRDWYERQAAADRAAAVDSIELEL